MNKKLRILIEIALVAIIALLVWANFNTVQENVDFAKIKSYKTKLARIKLQDIRELQFAYELKNNKYANSWDELINFVKNDSLEFTRKIGDLEDSVEVAEGRAYTEKVQESVLEKLKLDNVLSANFDLNTIQYIPGTDSTFDIAAGEITSGGTRIPTFEISAPLDVLLAGNDPQLIINLKENYRKRTGVNYLRIGKLDEASTEGNWDEE
jgi:uncharacterized protein YxeA